MTKKILALALAGTTAFSVFASAMTTSAKYADSYTPYTASTVTITPGGTPAFTLAGTSLVPTATVAVKGDVATPGQYKTALDEYADIIEAIEAKLNTKTTPSKITNGIVYLADYDHTDDEIKAWNEAISNLKAAYATAETYYTEHRTPGTTDTVWKNTNGAVGGADEDGTDALALFTNGDSTGLKDRMTATYTAANDVFAGGTAETAVDYGIASSARYKALEALNSLYDSEVKKYDTTSGGDGKAGVSDADFEGIYENADGSASGINLVGLFQHIAYAAKNNASTTTSKAIQLVEQYNAIKGLLEDVDTVSTATDKYIHFLEAVEELTESDYTAKAWGDIKRYIAYAAADYDAGKVADAVSNLRSALDVEPKAGSIAELESTLMGMYADTKGQTKKTYIKQNYVSASTPWTIYKVSDYQYKVGSTTVTTDEWDAMFSDFIWYYNPLDAEAADDAEGNFKELYNGVYGYAYKLWDQATDGEKVAQSRIDTANAMLIAAIEDLDPTTSSPDWELVKLEKTVELGESLVETDFNASSTKWKTFLKNLERAQDVLANPNAGKQVVTNVTNALNDSMKALKDVAKNPSYNLKKEWKEVLKNAKAALKALDDQNGAQYKALNEAIKNAEALGTALDVEQNEVNVKDLISDYEESIAELNAAMNYYEQPQGWYEGEGGWMYGEGDSYVASDWKKVGTKWFYFEDGIAVESNWRLIDGKYYYFNQYCVALTNCWGKVDGGWYYFGADSAMKTGWLQIGSTWYYLNPTSGRMMTGWVSVNGKSYYFNTDGEMLTSTTTPDGYEVGADGAWIQK